MARLRGVLWLGGIAVLSIVSSPAQQRQRVLEYPLPSVREEQTVIVDGREEVWRLKWDTAPKPFCEPSETSLTCPCSGFAYGESGKLQVIRLRKGFEIDHLDLNALFFEDSAVLQRWQPDQEKDWTIDDLPALAAKRPTVQIMHFADYDHDGQPTEFFLQNDVRPCGKRYGVVIGVTKNQPRLHVFGSARMPDVLLQMDVEIWDKLRTATKAVSAISWRCNDHGSDEQRELDLTWSPTGIEGIRNVYSCPRESGKLIRKEPF